MKAQAKSECQTGLGLAFPSSKKSYKRGPRRKKEKRKKKKRERERERKEGRLKKKKKRQVLFQQSSLLSNFLSKLSSPTVC